MSPLQQKVTQTYDTGMSEAMSDPNGDPTNEDHARTTIEVDREVWRQVRAAAVGDGKNVSVKLEEILREHFGMTDEDPSNNDS